MTAPTGPHPTTTERPIRDLAAQIKGLLWKPGARAEFNRLGIDVLAANFYSPAPNVQEIRDSFEYACARPPFDDCGFIDDEVMRSFLVGLMEYARDFSPPQEGSRDAPESFFWKNPAFGYSDAMAYYCVIRHLRPRRIVEVGSGFSTLVAAQALRDNGSGELICIEPFPRPFLRSVSGVTRLIEQKVQEIPVSFFQETLLDGDVLFIDSTHVVKTGSDCVWLYLKVLPALRARIMVHAHDIFLPESYPKAWLVEKQIYWNEQYLLQAFLTGNAEYEACFGSNYLRLRHHALLEELMGGKAIAGGGSFWFRRTSACARRVPAP